MKKVLMLIIIVLCIVVYYLKIATDILGIILICFVLIFSTLIGALCIIIFINIIFGIYNDIKDWIKL